VAKKQWTVARVRDEADRKSGGGGDFISLDEGEKFLGYFLGDADPKIDDPAYFEYKTHWVNKGSVPCAGEDDCPICADGERPRTKAMTLWVLLENEKGDKMGKNGEGVLCIFDMPVSVIKQFTELRAEDEKVKGRKFRISRPEEKTYIVLPKADVLKSKEVKEWMKDGPDFEAMLTTKLRKAMEGIAVARAMEDDDDDDDTPKSKKSKGDKASKGKGKSKPKDDDDDDDDDNDDDPDEPDELPEEGSGVEVVVTKINKENSILVKYGDNDPVKVWGTADVDVTELGKGQVVAITYVTDEEGDFVLTEDPEEKPEDDEKEGSDNDLPDSIDEMEFTISEINEHDQTIDVESDDLSFTLYFLDKGPASKIDFDDFSDGDKITVTAEKDAVGDMVATAIPEKVEEKKAKGGKGGKGAKSAKGAKGGKGKKK
jgi:hypothetical protein